MVEASVYQAGSVIAFVPHGRAPSGWVLGRVDIVTEDSGSKVEVLNDHLRYVIDEYDSPGDESRFDTKNFNKIIAKKTMGSSYATFLKHAASVSVVVRGNEIVLEPMMRSRKFKGFEGYKGISDVLPLSSLSDGSAMQRVKDFLDEIIGSYNAG